MTHYTARVEYALHSLLVLAQAGEAGPPSARDLADFQKLPIAFIQKLLTQLEKSGMVAAAEGVRGGWRLARHPSAISVLEIADVAQGKPALFECRNIRARCALWRDGAAPAMATIGICSIHAIMLAAEAAMRRELESRTLADIEKMVAAKTSPKRTVALRSWFADRRADRRAPARRSKSKAL